MDIARRNGYHGLHAVTLRALADVRMMRHDHGFETEAICRSALEICGQYGIWPEAAHVRLQLARFLSGRGEREASRLFVDEAIQLYGQLDMPVGEKDRSVSDPTL